jgi:MFS family permease
MIRFNVGRELAVLPLSLYTLGFTIGPILAAPLSELYGRRSIYWTTMPLLLIFTAIAGASNNLPVLIIFRLLAGIGGSGSLAVGAGTIARFMGSAATWRTSCTVIHYGSISWSCLGSLDWRIHHL